MCLGRAKCFEIMRATTCALDMLVFDACYVSHMLSAAVSYGLAACPAKSDVHRLGIVLPQLCRQLHILAIHGWRLFCSVVQIELQV